MIRGGGALKLTASMNVADVFPDFYIDVCYALFTLRSSQETRDYKYLNLSGITQTGSNSISSEKFYVDLLLEDLDLVSLQASLGEILGLTNEVPIYENVTICPLTSLTYNDTRITTDLKALIGAYDLTNKRMMAQGDDLDSLNPYTFFVDDVAQTITFEATQLNHAIELKIPVLKDDLPCLGGQSPDGEFYNFSFEGAFFTTAGDGPYYVTIPQMRRINAPQLNFNGREAAYTLSFQAVCGDDDTYERKPFRIFSPNSGAPDPFRCFITHEDGFRILLEDGVTKVIGEKPETEEGILTEGGLQILLEGGTNFIDFG